MRKLISHQQYRLTFYSLSLSFFLLYIATSSSRKFGIFGIVVEIRVGETQYGVKTINQSTNNYPMFQSMHVPARGLAVAVSPGASFGLFS